MQRILRNTEFYGEQDARRNLAETYLRAKSDDVQWYFNIDWFHSFFHIYCFSSFMSYFQKNKKKYSGGSIFDITVILPIFKNMQDIILMRTFNVLSWP